MNQQARAAKRPSAADFYAKGDELRQQQKLQEAVNQYARAVHMDPTRWEYYFDMGTVLHSLERFGSALICFERSAMLAPDNARVWTRLGNMRRHAGRHQDALQAHQRAVELAPENPSVHYNIGMLHRDMNHPAVAVESFDRALACTEEDPFFPQVYVEARWARALALLQMGNYEEGWAAYESRLDLTRIEQPQFPGTRWTGESLEGKTIFLTYEQRFGDVIHFVRFAPALKAMGARVLVQCAKELSRLLKVADGVDDIVELGADFPDYDFHIPLTSVPVVLKTRFEDIPARVPYINVPDYLEKLPVPMPQGALVKVGLVWAGKPRPINRSCPIEHFIRLMTRPEAAFYSFQLGPRSKDILQHRLAWTLHDLGRGIDDFYTSARYMQQMDLIITIDSAPVHLAGALGIPVWVWLLHYSDWRWMLDREDNPWYPTLRIFRQDAPNSWAAPERETIAAFDQWLDQKIAEKKNK